MIGYKYDNQYGNQCDNEQHKSICISNKLYISIINSQNDLVAYEININEKANEFGDVIINYVRKMDEKINNSKQKFFSSVTINMVKMNFILENNLPKDLKKLSIKNEYPKNKYYYNLDNLPSNLKKLKIFNVNVELNNLPNIEVLEICGSYSKDLDNLPSSLIFLLINCNNYKNKLDNLPSTLKSLFILCDYSLPLTNLPIQLDKLIFIDKTNSNIRLPDKIKSVGFDHSNNNLRRKLLKKYPQVIHEDSSESKFLKHFSCYDSDDLRMENFNNNHYNIPYNPDNPDNPYDSDDSGDSGDSDY